MPLVGKFFADVKPDYTPEAFWMWTTQPDNHVLVLYDDHHVPVAYTALCFSAGIERNYIFLFQSFATQGIDSSLLWRYLMKMSQTLKLPLLTHTNRSERALQRRYGFKKDSTIMVRFPEEV